MAQVNDCKYLKDLIIQIQKPVSSYRWKYQSPGRSTDSDYIMITPDPTGVKGTLESWKKKPLSLMSHYWWIVILALIGLRPIRKQHEKM